MIIKNAITMTPEKTPQISQDYSEKHNVRPLLSSIDVRRPANGEFFRVWPDVAYSFRLLILDNAHTPPHVVAPHLEYRLIGIVKRKLLFPVLTSYGEVLLLPVLETYTDNWNKSAHRAIELAKSEWIQMTSNRSRHTYEISSASTSIASPKWPSITPSEIFDAAFGNQFIDNISHPLVSKYGATQ